MGSMEQIFTIFNDYKIEAWGPMAGSLKICGLSKIRLEKIQSIINKIHLKYESFQCQIITVDNVNEYDDIYIGCLPPKVIRCDEIKDINKLVLREINHRFLLLNDCNLTTKAIKNGNYDIKQIPPLYRVFVCNDWLLMNFNHAIIDGLSHAFVISDILALLNDDMDNFNVTKVPYLNIEQCIDPKYASSALSRKIENSIPTNWAIKFGRFYANNSFLKKYNPLSLHRDDMLRFQFYFSDKILSFPLKPFDKKDYRLNFKQFRLSKSVSFNLRKQCKLHNVHMSSLFQYLITAAMIECHNELKNNYYKTMVNNVFTTIPMYRKPKEKMYLGIHANGYLTIVEYDKNIIINSAEFWKNIRQIDMQVLNDDMVTKVYKNKFPYLNLKKFMKEILEAEYDVFNGKSFGAPTVSNPGRVDFNKPYWKYKASESNGGANPGVGFGAPYILAGSMIKGIDEMTMSFTYGVQHLSENMAQKVVNKLQEKMEIIGSSKTTNYQSKL